jgi:hypothetical protein
MGRIVQQILDEMSSGSGILLFLQIILFDTAHSFTGIGLSSPFASAFSFFKPAASVRDLRLNSLPVVRGRNSHIPFGQGF